MIPLTKKELRLVYFGPKKIQPGETVVIQEQAKCLFRWNRLVNKGHVDDLWIEMFTIGSGSIDQLRGHGPVSLLNFAYGPLDGERKGDTAQSEQSITLVIQNRGPIERTFAANLEGVGVS